MLPLSVAVAAVLAGTGLTGGIPQGTLFLESHPPAKPGETYQVSDSRTVPLALNPCFRRLRADSGRLEARTASYSAEDRWKSEQLVVYKDVAHAKKALRVLRADLRRCADVGRGHDHYRWFTKPLAVGDEGLRAGSRFFESGEQAVATRRGSALYIVEESAWPSKSLPIKRFRGLIAQAEEMTVKICALPEAAC
ncbi:hypothetical protein ABZ297_13165 [Nonomuraea sp. NPDC005983]|uniref:hypothetical protein n=1 Tax=Nonomuraea sp. NPDC005983 TaxID=3155595 RepID=UPI0033B5F142